MLEKLKNELAQEYNFPPIITFLIISALLTIWSRIYLNTHIDVDTSWLIECLQRFLAGGTYINDFYETNPPLSFWIYLPAYPLYTYLNLDPKLSIFMNVVLYLAIADLTLLALLRREKKVTTHDLLVIMTALLMAQSWIAGTTFALKDHLITTFLLPVSLYQYRVTRELKTGVRLAASSIILGSIAVCLKPHYALFPALFFAHRLYTTGSLLKCINAPDFRGMLIIGISYLSMIWIFTPEFFDLLPEIISLYSVEQPFPLSMRYYYVVYAIFAAVSAPFIYAEKNQRFLKHSVYALSALSLISMIPFIIQDKGFHYQALPTLCYGVAATFIVIHGFAKELFRTKNDVALWISCAFILLIFGGVLYGSNKPALTKDEFMAQPLIDTIDELAWNRVYTNLYYKHELACLPQISSLKNGSRFGELWPLTGLTILANEETDPEKRKEIKKKMRKVIDLIVEDIKRYKPGVILIPQYDDPETDKPTRNFFNFLIKHEGFKENLNNYKYYDTILFSLDPNEAATSENMEKTFNKVVPLEIYILKRNNTL